MASTRTKIPVTAAVRALRAQGIEFEPHLYDYEERGGTGHSSKELGVEEHRVIKTLVMEDESRQPLVVLMHGDLEVSTKKLARILGVKAIRPCEPAVAQKHSGYRVGGTSPLGTRKSMPVYVERSVLELGQIFVNGGKRGFLVSLDARRLVAALQAQPVDVAAI